MKYCNCFVLMYKDCWHHLRNVWFGAVIKKICAHLADLLEEYLEEIHYSLLVMTVIGNLFSSSEKCFGGTVNYSKGEESMLVDYMRRYHPISYLYPVYQACGVSLQYIDAEVVVVVLMNIPHYLELLIWIIICGGDGIFEKTYIIFRSVEMVSLLRVLYILHISLWLPLRWLARNCGVLRNYGFGVADIPNAVDLTEEAFAEITKEGNLMLDDDFTMNIFELLAKKINPFKEYSTYMFEEQQICPVGLQVE